MLRFAQHRRSVGFVACVRAPQFAPRRAILQAAVISALAGSASSVFAVNGQWNVNAGGNWSTASNWTDQDADTNGDPADGIGATADITYNISTSLKTVTLDSNRTVGILNVGDTDGTWNFTLNNSNNAVLTLDNTGTTNAQINVIAGQSGPSSPGNSLPTAISIPLKLMDSVEISNNATVPSGGNRDLTISGAISGTGNLINKGTGNAPVTLSSTSSSFVGTIRQTSTTSVLQFSNDAALGDIRNKIELTAGATLALVSTNTVVNPLRTITLGTETATQSRLSSPDGSQQKNVSGNIVGGGGLIIMGGVWALSGDNTFSGKATVGLTSGGTHVSARVLVSDLRSLGAGAIASESNGSAISIQGTSLTSFGSRSVSVGGGNSGGFTFDVQDMQNSFVAPVFSTYSSINSNTATAFTKSGAGELKLVTTQTFANSGPALGISGGRVLLDRTGSNAGAMASSSKIRFSGGELYLKGNGGSTTYTQTLGNIALTTGGGSLVVDNNNSTGTTTVALGYFGGTNVAAAIPTTTPGAGSALNIRLLGGNAGGSAVVTSPATTANGWLVNGLLGNGRVTLNGADFATADATASPAGLVKAITYDTFVSATGDSTKNYLQTGGLQLSDNVVANTLKLVSNTTGTQELDLNTKALTLTSGALLYTGSNPYTIRNGVLQGTTTSSDIIIHQGGAGALTLGTGAQLGVTGAGTLTKTGSGTLVLTTATTMTGASYLTDGVVSISNTNQLPSGTINMHGATLRATDNISTTRVGITGTSARFDVAGGKTLTLSNSLATADGGIILSNTDVDGSGKLSLTGTDSKFRGGAIIQRGVLSLGAAGALTQAGVNTVRFGSGKLNDSDGSETPVATLQTGSFTIDIVGLNAPTSGAVVENGAASGTALLRLNNGADNTFAGVIRNGGVGTLGFAKGGAGKLTLTNTNTYTGATTLSAGTLIVNGSLASGSTVTVNGGVLGGSGAVNGAVTLNTGGTVSPGNSVDDLTTGAQTWNAGSTYVWEINNATGVAGGGAGPTSGWDLLNINGALAINGTQASPVVINVTSLNGTSAGAAVNFNPAVNYKFLIADATTPITLDPTIVSLVTTNFTNTFTGTWSVIRGDDPSITGGDSSQLYVRYAAVPEPATLGTLALGAIGLLRRRRAS